MTKWLTLNLDDLVFAGEKLLTLKQRLQQAMALRRQEERARKAALHRLDNEDCEEEEEEEMTDESEGEEVKGSFSLLLPFGILCNNKVIRLDCRLSCFCCLFTLHLPELKSLLSFTSPGCGGLTGGWGRGGAAWRWGRGRGGKHCGPEYQEPVSCGAERTLPSAWPPQHRRHTHAVCWKLLLSHRVSFSSLQLLFYLWNKNSIKILNFN